MNLIIVESPTKSKTIKNFLGKQYRVESSVGHVRDLPKSNREAIDIEAGFVPRYEVSENKKDILNDLKDAASKADEIYLATDPDREGEAIAWHLSKVLGLKNPKRIVFHEITDEAIQEALKQPRKIDQELVKAQEARRVIDRLVGYDLSGLIWRKIRYGLSAGRVQSPALRIIVEREREIRAFKSETYYVLTADVFGNNKNIFRVTCEEEPRDKKIVEEILKNGGAGAWFVKDITESEVKRTPRPPFTTSTLQQAASSRLGFSPSRTMSIAQKLYEQGFITYMRTDSVNLAVSAQEHIISYIIKTYGKEYAESRIYKTKSKNAQEAHEAVRPTDAKKENAGHTEEQKNLYRLIRERTIASQMADAKLLRAKITATITVNKYPDFSATGSRVIFDGWLACDTRARGEDVELPKVAQSEKLTLKEIMSEEKHTEPPPRYTEAGLVKELEKREIGRPSTYAAIIKTLHDRKYVEREGRALKPTDTGEVVSAFLEKNFMNYISDTFTAEMENELDEIATGKREYVKTLRDFYAPFHKDVKAKEKTAEKITNLGEADKKHKCPVCGGLMVIKLSRTGKFLSCKKFPECAGARKIDGSIMEGPKETGETCPKCQTGKLVEREGRFGKFISCNNYPKCKFIKKSAEEEARTKTGVACPKCGNGEIVERRGRFGLFYSCSNYPKCDFVMKSRPTGKICELCKSLMMEGTKTIPERCSNKNCPNHNPHKTN
ncbi:DNA topoisomerase I [Candidatus Wolfebacteria bacterium RIFCSPLOWO2_01_FULL_45_19]|uniref:DNA topoisomerase 1 n=1 Tax=Candidatus Wolfebacteria bacterium RIFCSPLOWO2_01_FULL_45_19 TaxID=1802557 RepID=A0A1F8DT37_9BACT|nr:MAG: DNA topoisomerase I [Candidatus Wolfebacteria bacterium RIFCSPLOWO2_01_FULL_45_19]